MSAVMVCLMLAHLLNMTIGYNLSTESAVKLHSNVFAAFT